MKIEEQLEVALAEFKASYLEKLLNGVRNKLRETLREETLIREWF